MDDPAGDCAAVHRDLNKLEKCADGNLLKLKCFQKAKEGDSSSLLSTAEATPEVLGPVLGSSVGERHGRDWRESNPGHGDDGQEHVSHEERLREEAQGLMVV